MDWSYHSTSAFQPAISNVLCFNSLSTTNSFLSTTTNPSSFIITNKTKRFSNLSFQTQHSMIPINKSPYSLLVPFIPSLPQPPLINDLLLTSSITVGVAAFLLTCQRITAAGILSSSTTRKVIHIICGPAFIAVWPLYSGDTGWPRLLATIIPSLAVLGLIISGNTTDETSRLGALGRAVSRGGKAREALQGPLWYCLVLLTSTIFLFRSVAAVVAIMQLSCGDAAAEVIGRRFGSNSKWGLSWTGNKSIIGTISFAIAGFTASCIGLAWIGYWGHSSLCLADWNNILSIAIISIICSAVELLPMEIVGDDNVTIALSAVGLSLVLFQTQAL